MGRRSDHTPEHLKEMILEESWRVIEKEGIEKLTARRIASAIGYTPGTIYSFFNSMETLQLHLNARTLDLLYAALSDPKCNHPDNGPIKNMKLMARNYISFAQKYRPHWLLLFESRLEYLKKDETWYQEMINRLFTPLEGQMSVYFSDKQKRKKKIAARVLWASVHGICFLKETGKLSLVGEEKNTEEFSYFLIDNFMMGIGLGRKNTQ